MDEENWTVAYGDRSGRGQVSGSWVRECGERHLEFGGDMDAYLKIDMTWNKKLK